ncbi:hypothetical protein EIN_251090 [Entamoeba invadens IP1]|uniref:DH domain-containing protein n=1 Tax=Entamoeba invadens IP1 TaxID=370355 RepID=A0A0A1UEF8_ENTIV|nr:hypothetical protein EIN_251090 [Entamoeba invadens IP1]ELP94965.1 hypothetical protein EIN_251090 [Entamoeba invadens IP1]|eukprot:XP_004261736.1 hypothetical protein EIN_251090 [Entamoeba invadens IP1]
MELFNEPDLTLLDVFMLWKTTTIPRAINKPDNTEYFFWKEVLCMTNEYNEYLTRKVLTALHNEWLSYSEDYNSVNTEPQPKQKRRNSLVDDKNEYSPPETPMLSGSFSIQRSRIKSHSLGKQDEERVVLSAQHIQPKDNRETPSQVQPELTLKITKKIGVLKSVESSVKVTPKSTVFEKQMNEVKNLIPVSISADQFSRSFVNPKNDTTESDNNELLVFSSLTHSLTPSAFQTTSRPKMPSKNSIKSKSSESITFSFDSELVARGEIALRERKKIFKPTLSKTPQKVYLHGSPRDTESSDTEWKLIETRIQRKVKRFEIQVNGRDVRSEDLVERYLRGKLQMIKSEGGGLRFEVNSRCEAVSIGSLSEALQHNWIDRFVEKQEEYFQDMTILMRIYLNALRPFCDYRSCGPLAISAMKSLDKNVPPLIVLERRVMRIFTKRKNVEDVVECIGWYGKEFLCYEFYAEKMQGMRELLDLSMKKEVVEAIEYNKKEVENKGIKVKDFEEILEEPMKHIGRIGFVIMRLLLSMQHPPQSVIKAASNYIKVISVSGCKSLKKLNHLTGMDLKADNREVVFFGGLKITSREFRGKDWVECFLFNDILVIAKIDVTEKYRCEKSTLLKFENAPYGEEPELLEKYYCKVEYTCSVKTLKICSDKGYSFTMNSMVCVCFNMEQKKLWTTAFRRVQPLFMM